MLVLQGAKLRHFSEQQKLLERKYAKRYPHKFHSDVQIVSIFQTKAQETLEKVEKWKRISEKMKNAKQSVSAIPLPLRKFQQVRSSAILSGQKAGGGSYCGKEGS